jgi:hypothetical protein
MTAITALCFGVLVYVFDRQAEFVYFLPGWMSLYCEQCSLFGSLGNYLPTFIHVYVFILLTAVIAVPCIVRLIPVCLAWLVIDSVFEIAQLNLIAKWIGSHTPTWFNNIPFLENTTSYFLSGTFDVLDLVSIVVGAITAYLTVAFILEGHMNDAGP